MKHTVCKWCVLKLSNCFVVPYSLNCRTGKKLYRCLIKNNHGGTWPCCLCTGDIVCAQIKKKWGCEADASKNLRLLISLSFVLLSIDDKRVIITEGRERKCDAASSGSYTRPKPLVFSMAVINLSRSFCRLAYSGNKSRLKQVSAVGNLFIFYFVSMS